MLRRLLSILLKNSGAPSAPALVRLSPPFQHCAGFEWQCKIPNALKSEAADSDVVKTRSRLLLYEDDKLVGPPHTYSSTIRDSGGGAYNHRFDVLYFSSSDGSDPNANGRSYYLRVGPDRPELLALGSCHVDFMLKSMEDRHPISQIYVGTHTHNTAEVIQFLRFCRREIQIPESLLPFVYQRAADLPVFGAAEELGCAKTLFLEVCHANLIRCGDTYLHRNLLKQAILVPLQKLGDKEAALANAWYYQGIERADERTRIDAVNQLLPLVAHDEAWQARNEILKEVEGHVQDEAGMKTDLARIAEMIGCKVIVLGHVLRYMPDGRPLYWPSTFMVQLRRIAAELGLPVLDPAKLMEEVGPSFALEEDGFHYTQQFIDLMADRMYEAL